MKAEYIFLCLPKTSLLVPEYSCFRKKLIRLMGRWGWRGWGKGWGWGGRVWGRGKGWGGRRREAGLRGAVKLEIGANLSQP